VSILQKLAKHRFNFIDMVSVSVTTIQLSKGAYLLGCIVVVVFAAISAGLEEWTDAQSRTQNQKKN